MRNRQETTITLKFLIQLYDCFLRDMSLQMIAASLEIPQDTLVKWSHRNPDVKMVREMAEQRRESQLEFKKFIMGRLSPQAKQIWDKISFYIESDDNTSPDCVRDIDDSIRKEIFLQALAASNWHTSKACRMAGISRSTALNWQQEPEFKSMMAELHEAKKDFFEEALMDLVACRYPGAVLFANRTQNADRGYNEKIQLEHTGQVNHQFDLNELDLDIDTRRKILEAIRRKNDKRGRIIDVNEVRQIPEKVTNGEVKSEDAFWDE